MLVGAHNRRVDEQVLHVGIAPQGRGYTFPNAFLAPTGETDEGSMPVAEFGGQVAPWAICPHDPKNRLNEAPIVLGCAARITRLAGQMLFNTLHWSSRNIVLSILPLPKSQDMTIFHPE